MLKALDENSDDPFAGLYDDKDELDRNELVVDDNDWTQTDNILCWYYSRCQ